MKRVAVITGGNRGLGFETCRQLGQQGLSVILTARDSKAGKDAVTKLAKEGIEALFQPLDVTDAKSIKALRTYLEKDIGRVDVLVNNAGVYLEKAPADKPMSIVDTPLEAIRKTMETNVYGPLSLARELVPLMQKNHYGRIVNVSSGMGQLADMGGGAASYRISKTALNAVTRILASDVKGSGILVNAVCPGWVKTDMGGPNAERTPEQGADSIAWLAVLPENGPTGGFFRDRKPIAW